MPVHSSIGIRLLHNELRIVKKISYDFNMIHRRYTMKNYTQKKKKIAQNNNLLFNLFYSFLRQSHLDT